jgi:DNA-binding CsgD family transcriptional regulator
MTGRRKIPYPTSLDALSELGRQLVDMCRQGKDYTAIARKLGANPRTISDRARHINTLVQPGQPPLLDAAHYGRVRISKSPSAINYLDQQIIDLYREGLEYQQIANRLGGIARQTIATRITRLRENLGEHILQRRHGKPSGERRNTADQSKKTARGGRVRCLGGCDQHFDSPDRCRIRICPKCKAKHRESGETHTEYRLFTA